MVEITIKIEKEERSWYVENPKVVEILKRIPLSKIPEYLEMYILLGDTVLKYASIQTSEEAIEKYFGGLMKGLTEKVEEITELRVKLEKEITENLPAAIKERIEKELKEKLTELKGQIESLKNIKDKLPDTVKAQLGEYIGKLEEAASNVKTGSEALSQFIGKYKGAKDKGKIGEDFVYNTLVDNFKDDSFEDVSEQANYSDIKAQSDEMVDILIEVKNYMNPVPSLEVQKFWKDLEVQDINIGCFISLGTRIQGGIGHYKIEKKGKRLGIFMNVGQFAGPNGMEDGVKLAYSIARKFAQYVKKMEREKAEEGVLRQIIDSVFKEIEYLNEKLEIFKDLKAKLEKIEKITKDTLVSIDVLYREFSNRLEAIMNKRGNI